MNRRSIWLMIVEAVLVLAAWFSRGVLPSPSLPTPVPEPPPKVQPERPKRPLLPIIPRPLHTLTD